VKYLAPDSALCKSATLEYYENWLGKPGCLNNPGVQYIYSEERNRKQYGYPQQLDIYLWERPGQLAISYGSAALDIMDDFRAGLGGNENIRETALLLSDTINGNFTRSIAYYYDDSVFRRTECRCYVRTLAASDYEAYQDFFLECHPGSEVGWLQEYFDSMVPNGYCVGAFSDGKLVSCTDSPGMPYLENRLQEIGVNTLSPYRGNGYAASVCSIAAKNILSLGRIPLWRHRADNIASGKVAQKIGFKRIAEILTIALPK